MLLSPCTKVQSVIIFETLILHLKQKPTEILSKIISVGSFCFLHELVHFITTAKLIPAQLNDL